MKRIFFGVCVLIIVAWAMPSIAQEADVQEPGVQEADVQEPEAQEAEAQEAEFEIARLVVTSAVEDREPVDDKEVFDASVGKVYCFLEARDVKNDTTVSFVWYHEDNVTASVDLTIGKSSRWRTYSSKKLGGRTGLWRVELQDASGAVLRDVTFTVQ